MRSSPAGFSPAFSAEVLNRQLETAQSLEARIAGIVETVPGRIAFSTSLGLEDQAILHAIARSGAEIDVFMLDTGRHFAETLDVIEASVQRYGRAIRIIAPSPADIESLVARDGINGFRGSIDKRRACCDVRKVRPLRRALAGASAWITGLRREQSTDRQTVTFATLDTAFNLLKVSPLADWTQDRIAAYVSDNDVPVNVLHARGFASIGCQPCTRAIEPGEHIRAGRWWWESEDGKECGLHRSPRIQAVVA